MAFYLEEGDHLKRIYPDGSEKYLGRLMILRTAVDNYSVWVVQPGPGFPTLHLLVQPDGYLVDFPSDRIGYRKPTCWLWRRATEPRDHLFVSKWDKLFRADNKQPLGTVLLTIHYGGSIEVTTFWLQQPDNSIETVTISPDGMLLGEDAEVLRQNQDEKELRPITEPRRKG